MKSLKRFALCFILLVLFTALAGTVQADTAQTRSVTLTRYTQSMDLTAKTVGLTLRAENNTDSAIPCVFYSVIENTDGQADSCQSMSATLQPGVNLIPLSHVYNAAGDGKQMAVYCWDRSMQPLSTPMRFQLTFAQTVTGITLNHTDVSLILSKSETKTLTYTYAPQAVNDPGVTFISSNSAVVAVNAGGVLTPQSPGTAEITVMTKDRSAYGVCKVTVISDVTKITLNQSAVILGSATDTVFQLKATVTPNDAPDKTLIYQSSNEKVATVTRNGLIEAVATGEATITVRTGDGQAQATCKVTVTAIATGISLNESSVTMWDYGMYTLTAKVVGTTDYKIRWTSSDDTIATVSDNGIVYGVAKGTAIITASVGSAKATCTVKVYREYDYTGSIAAHFESGDTPGRISGSGTGKSYGCFQLYAGSNGPKTFYNWLINSGFNPDIGNTLKKAHQEDGGKDKTFGTNFDAAWKDLASAQKDEFRSCQMAYCMSIYYEPLVNRLVTELNFYPDNYGLALKSAIWSRAVQHGTGGAFNRIRDAFASIGGYAGKTEKELITAIYKECGAVVSTPPSSSSIPMNSNSSIAVEYGLVGKYMKYYSSNDSSTQAGVWKRLNITELNMLYDLLENPPIVITV